MSTNSKSKINKTIKKIKKEERQIRSTLNNKTKKHKNKQQNHGRHIPSLGMIGSMRDLATVGTAVGGIIAKITGSGSYKVKNNTLMTDSQIPSFNQNKTDALVMSASEMITDVQSSITFQSDVWLINPTNQALFPRLSQLAALFEQYEFLGLVFMYKPTSAIAVSSTNTALGTIVLSTEYDVARPPFLSKQEAEAYEFSTSCVPSTGMLHPIECNPKQDIINARYTRGPYVTDIPPATNALSIQDNLSNVGRLQLISVGSQAVATTGELWVSYHVKLSKPRALPPSFPCQIQKYSGSTLVTLPISTGGQVPFSPLSFPGQVIGIGNNQSAAVAMQSDSTMPFSQGFPQVFNIGSQQSGVNTAYTLVNFDGTPANTAYRIEVFTRFANISTTTNITLLNDPTYAFTGAVGANSDYFFPATQVTDLEFGAGTVEYGGQYVANSPLYHAYYSIYVQTGDAAFSSSNNPYVPNNALSLYPYNLEYVATVADVVNYSTTFIITRVPLPAGNPSVSVPIPPSSAVVTTYVATSKPSGFVNPGVKKRGVPPNTPVLRRTDTVIDIEECHKRLSDQECWECNAIINPYGSHRPDAYYSDLCKNCDDKYKLRASKMH